MFKFYGYISEQHDEHSIQKRIRPSNYKNKKNHLEIKVIIKIKLIEFQEKSKNKMLRINSSFILLDSAKQCLQWRRLESNAHGCSI